MKAQLIRVEHSNKAWYFTKYVYKCIKCGDEYSRHACNDRINPYCGKCARKIDSEKAAARYKEQKEQNRRNASTIDAIAKVVKSNDFPEYKEMDLLQILDQYYRENKQ